MPKPEQGRIILALVLDPQSRNPKTRPAVIVSRNDEIEAEGVLECVAITTMIPDRVPDDCILLPFHPAGKCRTGLRKRGAAMCSWIIEIAPEDIEKFVGIVPPRMLEEILACIEKLKEA